MKLLGGIVFTMPASKQIKRNSHPPPTREMEYRMIINNVNDICLKIRSFAKTYFERKAVNYEDSSKCLSDLAHSWNMQPSDFKTWKEFNDMLKAANIEVELKQTQEFQDLEYICSRAKRFESIIPGIRENLVSCGRDHLFKYCQSFVEDIGSLDIRPVFDYDEAIKGFRKDIETKIDQINSNILTYGEMKIPFDKFVAEGSIHGTLMEEVCVAVVEVSHVMKLWVSEDATYPDRLLQEVFFNNSYKEKLEEDIHKLQQKRLETEKNADKKQKYCAMVNLEHEAYRREKKRLKNHLEVATAKIERLSVDLEAKNLEIENIQSTMADKTPRSHRDKQDLGTKLEKSEQQVDRVKEWRTVMERQKARLEKDLKNVSDRTYELKVEGVTLRHEIGELRQSMLGIDIEIKSIRDRIISIDSKTEMLKSIRVKKLSPDTLRRIHHRRVQPARKGNLEDACKFVAHYIGKDWKRLYERLPFEPAREMEKKKRDVEIIDEISARRYKTSEESAISCLEKWRVFNRHGDVSQLIKGLRKLNKIDIADELETKYLVGNVYS